MNVIVNVFGEGEGRRKGIEVGMRVHKGLVKSRENFMADIKFKEVFTLKIECIEFVILRKDSITIKSIESTEGAMSIVSGDSAISEVNFCGNRSCCDRLLETMVPRGVIETRDNGTWRDVVETYAAFICPNA